MKKPKLHFILFFLFIINSLGATKYYVSNTTGKTSGVDGKSLANAWKSITQVNATTFVAGDTIAFEGGQQFSGNIVLSSTSGGTAAKPVVFTTYGTGAAIINAGTANGIKGTNCGGFVIDNFEIVGGGATTNKGTGINFAITSSFSTKLEPVIINRVTIHGFYAAKGAGIMISDSETKYNGYKDLKITNSKIYDCICGVFVYDNSGLSPILYAHDNFYMSNCEVYNITATTKTCAVVICGVANGLIEYCNVHDCKGYGGLALWTYSVSNVVVQYCILGNYKTTYNDGGGLDFDGGSVNCVMQYCYTYNNDGMSAMVCDYPNCRSTTGNVIRYNISENDCRRDYEQNAFGFVNWGSGITNSYIYNNTVFLGAPSSKLKGGIGGVREPSSATGPTTGCKCFNNLVYLSGSNLAYVINTVSGAGTVEYAGNAYYNASGSSVYKDGGMAYASLDLWRKAKTDQEKTVSGMSGFEGKNPLFVSPGTVGNQTNPNSVNSITNYQIASNSPCVGTGIDIHAYYPAINLGLRDYCGDANSKSGLFNIGACGPFIGTSFNAAEAETVIKAYPNPCNGEFVLETKLTENSYLIICDMFGHQLKRIAIASDTSTIDIHELGKGIFVICLESKGVIVSKTKLISY